MWWQRTRRQVDVVSLRRRHELYAGYKGQRAPMPEEIGAALPKLIELLELMRIPTFQVFSFWYQSP